MSVVEKVREILADDRNSVLNPIGRAIYLLAEELDRVERSIGVKIEGTGGAFVDQWNRRDTSPREDIDRAVAQAFKDVNEPQ